MTFMCPFIIYPFFQIFPQLTAQKNRLVKIILMSTWALQSVEYWFFLFRNDHYIWSYNVLTLFHFHILFTIYITMEIGLRVRLHITQYKCQRWFTVDNMKNQTPSANLLWLLTYDTINGHMGWGVLAKHQARVYPWAGLHALEGKKSCKCISLAFALMVYE